jgi:hypothetical protein
MTGLSAVAVPSPARTKEQDAIRVERLIPFAVFAIVLVVAIMTITPWPVGVFEDDAMYTVLGKALAEGEGYRFINLPGAPHATHYPPGYPLLLALLWRVFPDFPDNIVVFKFANAVLLALAAVGAYHFARVRLAFSRLPAAGTAVVGTISVVVLVLSSIILSEPLFMALMFPALLVAERSAESGDIRSAFLAGVLFGALALIRTLGALAIPAGVCILLFRRRPRAAIAMALGAALLVLPWQLWVSAYQQEIPPVFAGKYGAYGPWLADGYRAGGMSFATSVIASNLDRLKLLLSYLFLPMRLTWQQPVVFLLVGLLLLGGLIAMAKRALVTAGFLVLYGVVITLWPFAPDRFVLGVWPLVCLLVLAAVIALYRWQASSRLTRVARLAALAVTLCFFAGHAMYNVRSYRRQWWASLQRDSGTDAKPIVEWVAHHTAMTDVLATEHDLMVYLYTGRQAVPVSTFLAKHRLGALSQEETLTWVENIIDRYKPRFYITGWDPAVRAADTLAARHPPVLRRVDNTTTATVYERVDR